MKALILILAALILVGCGKKDTAVTVGEPGQKGVIRHDIDQSKEIANGTSDKIKQGEKDVYGG